MKQDQTQSSEGHAPQPRPTATDHHAFAQVMAAISKLEFVIDDETEMLSRGQSIDLRDITARKSRGLYDLSRALRQFGNGNSSDLLEQRMRGLQGSLQRNQTILANHLRAVGELAELMRKAVEMDEADGTYTMRIVRGAAS